MPMMVLHSVARCKARSSRWEVNHRMRMNPCVPIAVPLA